MRKNIVGAILFSFILGGCSARQPTKLEYDANKDVESSIAACQEAQAKRANAEAAVISSLPEKDRVIIATQYLTQKNDIALIGAATGTVVDPCRQSNLFDMQIAEVREKTKQVREGTGLVRNAVPWVVGGLTFNAALDKAGQGVVQNYAANGNGKINVHSQNSGSDNYVGRDYQNNGTNTIDNSTCDNCDTPESGGPDVDLVCKVDADCPEGEYCTDGVCTDGATVDPVEPDVGLEDCLKSPPAGYNLSGTPLWSVGCSCGSHWGGKC